MIAVILVSQPKGNCVMYNLTSAQAEEFIGEVKYVSYAAYTPFFRLTTQSKHLQVFKESPEFGWEEVKRDVRRHIFIKNRKYGAVNSVKSYACALKGDGKIDKTIRVVYTYIRQRDRVCVYTSFPYRHGVAYKLCILLTIPFKFM